MKPQVAAPACAAREAPRLRTLRPLAILVCLVVAAPAASALIVWDGPRGSVPHFTADAPPETGPDVPGVNLVATVVAFEDEVWSFTSGGRTRLIDVPEGWDRVIAEYRQRPEGDPWDRLFRVFIGDVEVLRGTTPRTDFTLHKEWTRYASLLPQGGQASITIATDAWDQPAFSQHAYLTLRFYDDPAQPDPAASSVAAWGSRDACAKSRETRTLTFPDQAPERAVLEFFASNHGDEEAQFTGRYWSVRVDGVEVANITAFPFTYAILGFYGGNDVQHPVMWWTAQRALDVAGVHTGPGEVTPYRAELSAAEVALLQGATDVEIYSNVQGCVWITSAAFLLYG